MHYCIQYTPTEDSFNKLNNPLLNELRNFASSHEMFFPKCEEMNIFTKHEKVKKSF